MTVTSEMVGAMSERQAAQVLPDVVGLGAMRCGSTTLWRVLIRLGKVSEAAEKELHFFDDREGRYRQGLTWYTEQLGPTHSGRARGECTPEYFFMPEARERIARDLPDTRFVVVLRDPVKRAWSHYWHRVRQGREWLGFREALRAEETRWLNEPDPERRWWFAYARLGRYGEQLQWWYDVVGRDRLTVVLLEDLIRNPVATVNAVIRCCGLGAEVESVSLAHENKGVVPWWPWLHRVLGRGVRRYRVSSAWLPRKAGRAMFILRKRLMSRAMPDVPRDVAAELARALRSDTELLTSLLDRPLPWAHKWD